MSQMQCPECGTEIDEHPAGRCLDAWVAEVVMGWEHISENEPFRFLKERGGCITEHGAEIFPHEKGTIPELWRPSTDIAAAWVVVEKMHKEGWAFEISIHDVTFDVVIWKNPLVDFDGSTKDKNICLAICRAALKSVSDSGD